MAYIAKRYYPAFLDLQGRSVVIVGSGLAAERKAIQLGHYGANVTIVTSSPSDELVDAEADGKVVVEDRDYVRGDLAGAALVLCINCDEEVRSAVAVEARSVGCPVNISEAPQLSTFLIPGAIHREPLQIAVSTGGLSPELSKRVRRRIAELYDDDWTAYSGLVAEVRALGVDRLGDDRARLAGLMEALLDSDMLKRLRRGEHPHAEDLYREFLPAEAGTSDEPDTGEGESAE